MLNGFPRDVMPLRQTVVFHNPQPMRGLLRSGAVASRPLIPPSGGPVYRSHEGASPEMIAAHEKGCHACQAGPKGASYLINGCCMHPNCGCVASALRVHPWLKLRRCPAGNW